MRAPRDLLVPLGGIAIGILLALIVNQIVFNKMASVDDTLFYGVASALLGGLIAAYGFFIVRTLNKNPTSLKVAILGPPGSGKTVFLTVLFNELLTFGSKNFAFHPYGRETIETVTRNLNTLSRGNWLPRTPEVGLFPFRANVRISSGLIPRRYTVEIGDFAGEKIEEFDPGSERWLHRTEYFKYALSADALFLMVDGATLLNGERHQIDLMQNELIAAIQVIFDEKSVPIERGLREPVALVVSKADLIQETTFTQEDLLARIERLRRVCGRLCRSFQVFFVSSVGSVTTGGTPPPELRPTNVVEPMVWSLLHVDVGSS